MGPRARRDPGLGPLRVQRRREHVQAPPSGPRVLAAELAQAGFTGPTRVYEAEDGGFLRAFSDDARPERLLDGLGERYLLETTSFKPYSCCGSLHSYVDAALELRAKLGPPSPTARVSAGLSRVVEVQCGFPYEPSTVMHAQMSLRYCVAVALLEGAALPPQFTPEKLGDPALVRLAQRIELVPDMGLDRLYPEHFAAWVAAEDGERSERVDVLDPTGSTARPMDTKALAEKFRGLVEGLIPREAIARTEAAVAALEDTSACVASAMLPTQGGPAGGPRASLHGSYPHHRRLISCQSGCGAMSRFFVQLIKRVIEKEDVFTECLAAALQQDPRLLRDFLVKLCGEKLDGVDVRTATVEVSTQRGFPGTGQHPACSVDMVFTLNGARTIGVENKLWAAEAKNQLRNYLKLGLSRVAYITARDAVVAPDVLADQRYLKPPRGHFLWSDFYFLVEERARQTSTPLLTKALLELLLHFGFEPPKSEIGDLLDPGEKVRRRNRENFAKLWDGTRAELQRMGWRRIARGSIAELYVEDGPSKRVKRVWLDPTWGRGVLRIRLTPYAEKLAEVEESLRTAQLPHKEDLHVQRGVEARRVRDREFVQVTISLRKLLGDTTQVEAMKKSLTEFVGAVFEVVG